MKTVNNLLGQPESNKDSLDLTHPQLQNQSPETLAKVTKESKALQIPAHGLLKSEKIALKDREIAGFKNQLFKDNIDKVRRKSLPEYTHKVHITPTLERRHNVMNELK